MADPTAERATGHVRGDILPLGRRRRVPTVLETSAKDHTTICVPAGRRGLKVEPSPLVMASLIGATPTPTARVRGVYGHGAPAQALGL